MTYARHYFQSTTPEFPPLVAYYHWRDYLVHPIIPLIDFAEKNDACLIVYCIHLLFLIFFAAHQGQFQHHLLGYLLHSLPLSIQLK